MRLKVFDFSSQFRIISAGLTQKMVISFCCVTFIFGLLMLPGPGVVSVIYDWKNKIKIINLH